MDTRHLIDPELAPVLDLIPPMDFASESLPAVRASLAELAAAAPPPEDLPVSVETIEVPGPADAPPVRVLAWRPTDVGGALPAVFHLHGGGYVLGGPEMMDADHRRLAVDLGCAIYSVDYRLAPETPCPGGVEDCYAALKWLKGAAESLGVDPGRIGLKGESAGGGMAAALALLVRDRGEMTLSFQHLIYPMLDDRTCVSADPHPFTGQFVWTAAHNRFGWTSLLGADPGGADASPYAAAARAPSLAGLPPTFISVGALDLFLEEDLDYARRLTRAGVPVELHVYPGAFHGFGLAAAAAVSLAAARDSREALRAALRR